VKGTLAVTISGLWRFSREAIDSLAQCVVAPLQREHDLGVFIHAWVDAPPPREEVAFLERRLPVKGISFERPEPIAVSAFDGCVHHDKDRYRSQWEGVARVFDLALSHMRPDAILRTRMDLVYLTPLRLPSAVKDREIYIPPVEGHSDSPFNPSVVNDQMAFGSRRVMETYMQLARRLVPGELARLEAASRQRASRDHAPSALKGIEGILREYLAAERIAVRRLAVFYRLQRAGETGKLRFCASLPMFVYGRSPNRLSPWLLDRSFAILSRLSPPAR
jgi:hypothetical protein